MSFPRSHGTALRNDVPRPCLERVYMPMICRSLLEITEGAFTAGLFHRHDGVKERLSAPFMTIPRIEVLVDIITDPWVRRSPGG
jgi:hypothetical protein